MRLNLIIYISFNQAVGTQNLTELWLFNLVACVVYLFRAGRS